MAVAGGRAQAARVISDTCRGRRGLSTDRSEQCKGQGGLGMEPHGRQGVGKHGPQGWFADSFLPGVMMDLCPWGTDSRDLPETPHQNVQG